MPSRKPTELKKLAGTLRPDRVHLAEPRPPAASGYCPRDLPESAKKWWRKVAPVLAELGLLTVLDVPAARDMILCAARLVQCEQLIEEKGILVPGARNEGLVKNPAIAAANQYRAALYRWASKFGLTPSDRAGLQVLSEEREPSLAEVLFNMTVSDDDAKPG